MKNKLQTIAYVVCWAVLIGVWGFMISGCGGNEEQEGCFLQVAYNNQMKITGGILYDESKARGFSSVLGITAVDRLGEPLNQSKKVYVDFHTTTFTTQKKHNVYQAVVSLNSNGEYFNYNPERPETSYDVKEARVRAWANGCVPDDFMWWLEYQH